MKNIIKAIKRRNNIKLLDKVEQYIHCKNVELLPEGSGILNVEEGYCSGAYYNNTIYINMDEDGVGLIDTLFHEDRHYMQDKYNKYPLSDSNIPYKYRPCEVDARRYAFVQTIKFCLQARANTWNPMKKLGLTLILKQYTMFFSPWKITK